MTPVVDLITDNNRNYQEKLSYTQTVKCILKKKIKIKKKK